MNLSIKIPLKVTKKPSVIDILGRLLDVIFFYNKIGIKNISHDYVIIFFELIYC